MKTSVVAVDATKVGLFKASQASDILDELQIEYDSHSLDAQSLFAAAKLLRESAIPVAFPTETVYGLGADATRSEAVRGIYKAKQRPSDNPLIVHFSSLRQIREILTNDQNSTRIQDSSEDVIPPIYHPLIRQFWPGPLTILLPNPSNSRLAAEVTAGQSTFGARIPRHAVALALIAAADVPVAAPSANASTKPSPTAAEHVAHDLNGRIELILDAGPCEVGVESTVVDGLSQPPAILRPGGISLEQIRACPGWSEVTIGYKNTSEQESKPRAPGMKYRHYSPKAPVILVEAGNATPSYNEICSYSVSNRKVGLIRTRNWILQDGDAWLTNTNQHIDNDASERNKFGTGFAGMLQNMRSETTRLELERKVLQHGDETIEVVDIHLGSNASDVARGIFATLRRLDQEDVAVILVEGIEEAGDDLAAAVMNRLRKAAEIVT